jgi:tetratricopeptide (TPR) repeat protein
MLLPRCVWCYVLSGVAWAGLMALAMCPAPVIADEPRGQADLDAAIEAKLSANSLDDYDNVIDLCRRAIDKGLAPESKDFADALYTGTLMDRAGMVVDAIFNAAVPDPQWPRMRSFAMRDLNEAVRRDPKLGEAHLMIARLEALPGGNRERARKEAEKAIEVLGDDKLSACRAQLVLGGLAADDKERGLAYDKAVELAPRDVEARRTRGLFHLVNDRFAEARADLEVAIEEEPEEGALYEAIGMAYLMEEKLDEAEKAFDKAIEINPQAPTALLQRARVLALQGERPEAIADLDKAIELKPDEAIPLILRARILQQAGDTDKALADIEKVLTKQADHPAALELRGLIAAEKNDYAAAIRDFRRLLDRHDEDAVVHGQLGMLHLAAKQPRAAIKEFTRAIELAPGQFGSWRGRSDAEISIGEHAKARADLEKALELQPDDDGVLNNLAWLLATSPDDALRDGKRAIELATKACEATEWKEAHIISTLAAGYAETGDFETAKKYSKQAVELGSETDDVKSQLQKELESYEERKPWREKQTLEEAEIAGLAPAVAKASSAKDDDDDDDDKDDDDKDDDKNAAAPAKPRRPF